MDGMTWPQLRRLASLPEICECTWHSAKLYWSTPFHNSVIMLHQQLQQHRGAGHHAGRTSRACLHTGDHTARHSCGAARRQAARLDALRRPSYRHAKLHRPASVAVHAAAATAPASPTLGSGSPNIGRHAFHYGSVLHE